LIIQAEINRCCEESLIEGQARFMVFDGLRDRGACPQFAIQIFLAGFPTPRWHLQAYRSGSHQTG
jgi:hypothetical protein